jgi:hypothetical protein
MVVSYRPLLRRALSAPTSVNPRRARGNSLVSPICAIGPFLQLRQWRPDRHRPEGPRVVAVECRPKIATLRSLEGWAQDSVPRCRQVKCFERMSGARFLSASASPSLHVSLDAGFCRRRPQPLRDRNFPGRASRPPRGRCAANSRPSEVLRYASAARRARGVGGAFAVSGDETSQGRALRATRGEHSWPSPSALSPSRTTASSGP